MFKNLKIYKKNYSIHHVTVHSMLSVWCTSTELIRSSVIQRLLVCSILQFKGWKRKIFELGNDENYVNINKYSLILPFSLLFVRSTFFCFIHTFCSFCAWPHICPIFFFPAINLFFSNCWTAAKMALIFWLFGFMFGLIAFRLSVRLENNLRFCSHLLTN